MNPETQEALRNLLIGFPVFLFAPSFHEAAHAIVAKWGGDLTSAYQGRITLNPIAHIHPVGTIIIPIIAVLQNFPLIGWAKPVPVVESNYRRGRGYGVIVALAGPFSNLLLALVTVVLMQCYYLARIMLFQRGVDIPDNVHGIVGHILSYSLLINLVLMFFNLLPIPPLDGSHVLWHGFVKSRPQFHQAFATVQTFSYFVLILIFVTPLGRIFYSATVLPAYRALSTLAQLPVYLL